MCHLWRNDESHLVKPSLGQWRAFLASLAQFCGKEMNIIFGGGEPLLMPDLLIGLIGVSRGLGFRTSLATSGYFIDKEMAQRLGSCGLDYIALTVYSLKKEIHNFLRGMPDSHEKVLLAIEYLAALQSPPEIAIDTVIMEPNMDELLGLGQWVRNDKRLRSIFFQAVVQPFHTPALEEWYHSEEYRFLWPKDQQRTDLIIAELIKMKESDIKAGLRDKINNPISQLKLFASYFTAPQHFIKRYACNVTNGEAFTVSPDGSIRLCPYLQPIGNIRDGSIAEIWYAPKAQQRRRELAACKKNCHHIVNCWYEEEAAS
jgi:radical SAM protein with 4Fe4S-binding SPASM domain